MESERNFAHRTRRSGYFGSAMDYPLDSFGDVGRPPALVRRGPF